MSKDKKIKVLLAEDDKFISRAYQDGLTRAGFEIILAEDGDVALELLKTETPDIILIDIIMPEKNGFEVLEAIQKNDRIKDIPVIVLSNLGQDSDVAKGKELGAVDYLIKSNYAIEDVVNKINEHIKK